MEKILEFLKGLKKNNTREWMAHNKKWYEEAKKAHLSYLESLLADLSSHDADLEGVAPKDCVFRLHRDVRFSSDKSPFKTHFGAVLAKGGKKTTLPLYYLHIEPSASFLAAGIYMPESDVLKRIRQEIDYNGAVLSSILNNVEFKKHFEGMEGEKLKTVPKGFPKDHPQLHFLQHKSFIVSCKLSDDLVLSSSMLSFCVEKFKVAIPFNRFFQPIFE